MSTEPETKGKKGKKVMQAASATAGHKVRAESQDEPREEVKGRGEDVSPEGRAGPEGKRSIEDLSVLQRLASDHSPDTGKRSPYDAWFVPAAPDSAGEVDSNLPPASPANSGSGQANNHVLSVEGSYDSCHVDMVTQGLGIGVVEESKQGESTAEQSSWGQRVKRPRGRPKAHRQLIQLQPIQDTGREIAATRAVALERFQTLLRELTGKIGRSSEESKNLANYINSQSHEIGVELRIGDLPVRLIWAKGVFEARPVGNAKDSSVYSAGFPQLVAEPVTSAATWLSLLSEKNPDLGRHY